LQNWVKLGRVFLVNHNFDWMNSHASVPIAENIEGDLFKIYFTTRNKDNESSIGYVIIDLNNPKSILKLSKEAVLLKGDLGLFDDSGVMASCILNIKKKKYLYYIGWNLGVTVPFRNALGVAISDDGGKIFKRAFSGPILDRTKNEPHFVASSCVIQDGDIFKVWYLSCTGWSKSDCGVNHHYHIKYAESEDGIEWDRKGDVAIDYKDQYEYAISVPRVIKEDGKYKMWFSSRGAKGIPTYRIRYAESDDGKKWLRKDNHVGLDVSENAWDSEMICYPFVFDHKGRRYMLYNGNGYGESGFGLAVLS